VNIDSDYDPTTYGLCVLEIDGLQMYELQTNSTDNLKTSNII